MAKLDPPTIRAASTPGPYFHLDNTRMSLRELWRRSHRPGLFLTLVGMKLLGMRAPFTHLVPHVDLLQRVGPADLPGEIANRRAPAHADLVASGFAPGFSVMAAAPGQVPRYETVYQDRDRLTMAIVRDARPSSARPVELELITQSPGDHWVVTLDHPPPHDPPPWSNTATVRSASVADLIARHRDRLETLGTMARRIEPADLESAYREAQRRLIRHLVGRGVLALASPDEMARACATTAPNPSRRTAP